MVDGSDKKEGVKAVYQLKSKKGIEKAAHDLAIGQSIGNPDIRTPLDDNLQEFIPSWELRDDEHVIVRFPGNNFGSNPSLNYILSVVMGGQMDIGHIETCRLVDIEFDGLSHLFLGPAYGVEGIRKLLGVEGRPLIGGIVKPKIGLSITQLADICKQMADGGADFIKEDEILNFQEWCPLEERVKAVNQALESYNVLYAPCVTADDFRFPQTHVKAVHMNIWCGLGYFQIMRRHIPYRPALFFQKSGDKVWTTGPYSIDYAVICKLVNRIGFDFAHVGMVGGYLDEPVEVLKKRIEALANTIPSFSCGAKPKDVGKLREIFGDDIMVTSGGYIHGHPNGIAYAVRQFREACHG